MTAANTTIEYMQARASGDLPGLSPDRLPKTAADSPKGSLSLSPSLGCLDEGRRILDRIRRVSGGSGGERVPRLPRTSSTQCAACKCAEMEIAQLTE
eukprot:471657-Pyramimonas_sp.AAC.2